jgi:hypothetical protein
LPFGGWIGSSKARDQGTLDPALALAVPARIFRRVPCRVLAPFLEIGIAAFRKVVSPCGFERRARRLKISPGI